MRFQKIFIYYLIIVGLALGLIFLIFGYGNLLHPAGLNEAVQGQEKSSGLFFSLFNMTPDAYFHDPKKPFILVLMQLVVIIVVSRLTGYVFHKIGQQKVIGEIIAGIILGPSVVGSLFPAAENFIFPDYSINALYVISQLGLILFMFIIGMEINFESLKNQGRKALFISHTTIAFTSLLGFVLSLFLYTEFAPKGTGFTEFALFIAISLSITAFPVMARILQERKMLKTQTGILLMAIAAIDDVTAWCLLAVLTGIAGSADGSSVWLKLLLVVGYLGGMIFLVKPILNKFIQRKYSKQESNQLSYSLAFVVLLVSAFSTRVIGVHALFGAFVAGLIMPVAYDFRKVMIEKIQDFSTIVMMPVFFTLAGLRAHTETLVSAQLWFWVVFIILIASVGKVLGGTAASRLSGFTWKESLATGTLLNTRGMMEIIVLNIGLDLGIITSQLYTIFLLMTLATTFLTVPGLNLVENYIKRKD